MADDMGLFREAAEDVRNWGRWGPDDELGTLNFITTDKVTEAAGLVRQGKVISLGGDFSAGGPQAPSSSGRTPCT